MKDEMKYESGLCSTLSHYFFPTLTYTTFFRSQSGVGVSPHTGNGDGYSYCRFYSNSSAHRRQLVGSDARSREGERPRNLQTLAISTARVLCFFKGQSVALANPGQLNGQGPVLF